MIGVIALALNLLGALLASAKQTGVPAEIVTDLESAVASLQKVASTPVTFQQLEGLRTTPKW